MSLKVKSILYTASLWTLVLALTFVLQLLLSEAILWSEALAEQANTFIFGLSLILLISLLQYSQRFPALFETKWYLFHIIICAFSYLTFDALFVHMNIAPDQGMLFVQKSSSLGNELIDKILGNGFGIYAIVLLIFSLVYKRHNPRVDEPKEHKTGALTFRDRFKVKLANKTYFLQEHDIRFIRSSNNYSDLYTKDGKHVIRESISSLEKELDPTIFMRIHRSIIIRIDEVLEFISSGNGDYKVKLKNEEIFNIGNKYKPNVIDRFGL